MPAIYFWAAAVVGGLIGYAFHSIQHRRCLIRVQRTAIELLDKLAFAVACQPDMNQEQIDYWNHLLDGFEAEEKN